MARIRAPAPLSACGQSAPTAKKRVAMATPNAPLAGSRAMIDHVMPRDHNRLDAPRGDANNAPAIEENKQWSSRATTTRRWT
jgi:hypothetical protein